MKKALLAALTFIVVGFMLVNGTFADDFSKAVSDVFKYVQALGEQLGMPTQDTSNTVNVALVSDDTPQQLYPGGEAKRTTYVHNEGDGAVYFRLVYAVQYDADSWDKLHIDFVAGAGFVETDWQEITIGTTRYKMKVFTYTEALASKTNSPAVTLTIAMDTTVTSEEITRYREDFLLTQVLAIETTAFENRTATEALDLALPLDANFNPF